MIDKDELTEVGAGIKISIKNFVSEKPNVEELISRALELEVNLVDIVNVLGIARTENRVGKVINNLDCREDLFIITKGGINWESENGIQPAGSPENIRENVEKSLQKLGVDTIDCFQIYWPDKTVPLDETIGQLDRLREEGLIRYTGVANFSRSQLKTALQGGTIDYIQFPYNLYRRQAESNLLDYCQQNQIRSIAHEGLCHGLFTDEFIAGELNLENSFRGPTEYIDKNYPLFRSITKKIAEYVKDSEITGSFTSTMIKWGLKQKGLDHFVVVAYDPEHIDKIAGAREIELTAKQAKEITSLAREELEKNLDEDSLAAILPEYMDKD
ncbi:MAG: aldo/keto reductase [bacterium]